MSIATHFRSGRTGRGEGFVSDRSGSPHARFLRLTSYALMPLGTLSAWWLMGIAGKPLDAVRAEIGRPFPALTLVLFAVIGMVHARYGMDEIIEDYIHDAALKATALKANRWAAHAISGCWVAAVLLIAAPR